MPCLGRVPFDPELARISDRGVAVTELAEPPGTERAALAALRAVASALTSRLEEAG